MRELPRALSTVKPTFVLVHSPLVGPATWRSTAHELRARGFTVVVPSTAGFERDGPSYYESLISRVAGAVRSFLPRSNRQLVFVGHSAAGSLLPTLAANSQGSVMAVLFVDAVLPHPGLSWMESAPPALGDQLRALAADGRLPPWHEWFPPGSVEALLPDSELRAAVFAELPRLPLAYFDEPAPNVERAERCGYLQLSEPYRPLADEAERLGWPTIREAADHLAILTRPRLVVDRIVELVEALTAP